MAEKKGWGSTVVGWFVTQDQQSGAAQPEETPEQEPGRRRTVDRRPPAEPLNVFATPPPPAPGGAVDFEKVFDAAGIAAEARERVTRTMDLLNSLPADSDANVKKQIVFASLKAFAVPIDNIIEAGAQQLQALEAYIRAGAADTSTVADEADQRIKQYEQEIVKLRQVMQERVQEQQEVVKNCNARKLEVQKVLEFFGQDAVAKVVRESPKLQEPKTGP
ncbi:MAG: hypothetical protein ACXW2F_03665 [Thermoanaerobaculia bacterium]